MLYCFLWIWSRISRCRLLRGGYKDLLEHNEHNYNHLQYTKNSQTGDKRSRPLTTAAIVCSTIAISTICCLYLSVICGVLGIIYALLSKGGELTMSQNAKAALWISVFAIFLSITLVAGSFLIVIMRYGSLEAFWNAYMEMVNAYMAGP